MPCEDGHEHGGRHGRGELMQPLRLQLGDKITAPETGDYMRRYHLELTRDRAIRFHHITASDPGTDLHDHPWDFVSVILAGSYTEITPGGATRYEAPCVITRKAEQLHRLVLDEPAWTYFVCGRVRRH
jgi:hypothetical protein